MRALGLACHLHYCAIGEERVFLDLARDRYFSLPPEAAAAFRALEQGHAASPDLTGLDLLLRTGLLVDAAAGKPVAATRAERPTESLAEARPIACRASLRASLEVLMLVASARRSVRGKRLPALFTRLVARAPRTSAHLSSRDGAVAMFVRVRPLVPIAPNCLQDSIALKRFLQRRGITASLVIGAKLHPFAAHAWVQDGPTVLNDSLGHARDFEPVLVT